MKEVERVAVGMKRPADSFSAQRLTFNPVTLAKRQFRAWWHAKLPLSDTTTLTQRNVYILPTWPGVMMAATLVILLIASINYQLNLGYLLTFLLTGCGVVGMHVCHATLRGLTLNLMAPEPQFAGASATLRVSLTNERHTTRHGIGVGVLEVPRENKFSWTDVPALGSCVVEIAFKPDKRGLHRVPTLTAETRFPLGTFRVWTVWRPAAQVLVYPQPEAYPPPLPPDEPRAGGAARARAQATGDFDGVRAYRRGDPLKLVMWKKAAKAEELVSRDSEQAQRHELWLDFREAGHSDPELRLSRLAAWVLQADRLGIDFGLRLPGLQIAPANGEPHKRRCLEALALC